MQPHIWRTVAATLVGFVAYLLLTMIASVVIVSVASFFHHIPNARYNPTSEESGGFITNGARLLAAVFVPVVATILAGSLSTALFKRWNAWPLIGLIVLSATPIIYYAFKDGWHWPATAIAIVNLLAIVSSAFELRTYGRGMDL